MIARLVAILLLWLTSGNTWATCTGTDAYSTEVCSLSPCHYYRMDASSGSTETDHNSGSCGVINASYHGGFTLNQTGLGGGAGTDTAVLFDGVSGTYGQLADSVDFYPVTASLNAVWAATAWIKGQGNGNILGSGAYPTFGYSYEFYDGGDFEVVFKQGNCNTTSIVQNGGSGLNDGNWHFIGVRTIGNGSNLVTNVRSYLDATKITDSSSFAGDGSICGQGNDSGFPTWGNLNINTASWHGTLDEVSYFSSNLGSTALSDANFLALYNAGVTAPAHSGWPFTLSKPQLPHFRNDGYFSRLVRDGYNVGRFGSKVAIPQFLTVGYAPFDRIPRGDAR